MKTTRKQALGSWLGILAAALVLWAWRPAPAAAAPASHVGAGPVGLVPSDTDPAPITAGQPIFKSECVVCHGTGGKGDGPVAVALNPKPANLTDTTRLAQVSDDSLVAVITHGRRGMPGFKDDLSAAQIREVVAYIRTLRP